MKSVLAVVGGRDDQQVTAAAEALAALLGIQTVQFRLPPVDQPRQAAQILARLSDPDVACAALSVRTTHTTCWTVLTASAKPVLVIPEHCERTLRTIGRVLLPLDGTDATARSVSAIVRHVDDAGAQIVAMHVFDSRTVPAFWDQSSHAHTQWMGEFLARNLPGAAHLELCQGRPAEQVRAAADPTKFDLLVLGWSQDLGAEHAAVVRQAVNEGAVAVLLTSTRADDGEEGPWRVGLGTLRTSDR